VSATLHKVFIYGTLKRGFPNHAAGLFDAEFLGDFETREPFPFVIGGRWFSPYLLDEPGEGLRVRGELFGVSESGLERLDEMEGVRLPRGYRRRALDVAPSAGGAPLGVWTYLRARETVEGIHSGPLAEYLPDPRYVIPELRGGQKL
jgi:gamma-glutamylaminecyclotransferase